jgi:hypothetical protein
MKISPGTFWMERRSASYCIPTFCEECESLHMPAIRFGVCRHQKSDEPSQVLKTVVHGRTGSHWFSFATLMIVEWFNDLRLFVCKISSLIWREVFDIDRVRKIFVVKWEEVRKDWKSLRNWTLTVCVFDLPGQGFQIQNISRPNEWLLHATKSTGKKTTYF